MGYSAQPTGVRPLVRPTCLRWTRLTTKHDLANLEANRAGNRLPQPRARSLCLGRDRARESYGSCIDAGRLRSRTLGGEDARRSGRAQGQPKREGDGEPRPAEEAVAGLPGPTARPGR